MRILLIGGTGFIGRHLAAHLVGQGHAVYVPTRHYQKGRDLLMLPTAELLDCDIHNDAALDSVIEQSDVVINLVGILHSRHGHPYGKDFEQVHVELPRRIARSCRQHNIARFVHISALGADHNAPSAYLRSKAAGEAAIVAGFSGSSDWAYTIFRPSIVFGPDDKFMNLFARLARWMPLLILPGAKAKMQPVYVGDVARAIADCLEKPEAQGRVYDLAGGTVYTLGELVSLAARWSGHPRPVINLPMFLGRLQALFFELLPGEPLMSRDNLNSLKVDNISSKSMALELGIVPTPLESVAPRYLKAIH